MSFEWVTIAKEMCQRSGGLDQSQVVGNGGVLVGKRGGMAWWRLRLFCLVKIATDDALTSPEAILTGRKGSKRSPKQTHGLGMNLADAFRTSRPNAYLMVVSDLLRDAVRSDSGHRPRTGPWVAGTNSLQLIPTFQPLRESHHHFNTDFRRYTDT